MLGGGFSHDQWVDASQQLWKHSFGNGSLWAHGVDTHILEKQGARGIGAQYRLLGATLHRHPVQTAGCHTAQASSADCWVPHCTGIQCRLLGATMHRHPVQTAGCHTAQASSADCWVPHCTGIRCRLLGATMHRHPVQTAGCHIAQGPMQCKLLGVCMAKYSELQHQLCPQTTKS